MLGVSPKDSNANSFEIYSQAILSPPFNLYCPMLRTNRTSRILNGIDGYRRNPMHGQAYLDLPLSDTRVTHAGPGTVFSQHPQMPNIGLRSTTTRLQNNP